MRAPRLSLLLIGLMAGFAVQAESEAPAAGAATPLQVDFLDAAYLPGLKKIAVTGFHGMVGLLDVGDTQATLKLADNLPDADFTALAKISDTEILLGSSKGRIYHFDGTTVTEVAAISEYDEPVLDIAASDAGIWAVGARGLVAKSKDGKEFENLEIRDVVQPLVVFPAAQPADWYFGVSNVDTETLEFNATLNGEPAIEEEHYIMYPDEGFVQIQVPLDENPPPSVQFKFNPGPPFRAGDVSWNAVSIDGNKVTISGEFGMIFQTEDGGESWIRRNTQVVPREPEPAYWMATAQKGDTIWLTGAAGVNSFSSDGGVTWTANPKPGREGIFGVALLDNNVPVISGAVGLIGTLEDNKWRLADRTQLRLLSWLRTPVAMPDGTLLITGGRSTAIRIKDGEFIRVPVTLQ